MIKIKNTIRLVLQCLISVVVLLLALTAVNKFELVKLWVYLFGVNDFGGQFLDWGACIAAAAVLHFTLSRFLAGRILKLVVALEEFFAKMSAQEAIYGTAGLIAGLSSAVALSVPFLRIPSGNVIAMILLVSLGALGFNVGRKTHGRLNAERRNAVVKPKILDSSVIIDGRILDIIQTGFLEGKLIIPSFILEELRHIADSSDPIRKGKGRMGLEVLNKLREQSIVAVEIADWRVERRFADVDSHLLKMAEELDASLVTNDYNLNKIAEFQKVNVLNINELSNAVKAIVVPGQKMMISVVKHGKEPQQGVAYLNDGAMVVVEDGREYVGEEVTVTVTSILQTAAGRMIFARVGAVSP